ncbi:unnamed protein product [Diatraea saccharalis]|uniref:C2H2-type domain-containing protein n=1 Tax=Diatraea saccharalis TaxID=40085 RepID=A0A9N9WC98_9NEOP|nr:unnamed protein product [Diatraea saccharalis]
MPKCFICQWTLSTAKDLCNHIKYIHRNHKDYYECIEQGCNRKYFLKNSFKKHLATCHPSNINLTTYTIETETNLNNENMANNRSTLTSGDISENPSTSQNLETNNSTLTSPPTDFSILLIKYSASLYANPLIPRNVVENVMTNTSNLFHNSVVVPFTNMISSCLSQGQISKECCDLFNQHCNSITDSFKQLDTEKKCFASYKTKGSLIFPEQYFIGQRLECNSANNTFNLVPVTASGQLIPLRLVLKKFFELEGVAKDTIQYHIALLNSSDSDIIQNIVQGSEWQKKVSTHQGQIVLPLAIYFDDFEVGNPLGSHAGIHKLGAAYVSILSLPPHYTSKLRNIFLALLFHSSDRSTFGNKMSFKPLISELNYLKHHGIQINVPRYSGKILFDVAVLLGDNLGIHTITGFSESFSSNFPCRVCKIHKSNLKHTVTDDYRLYRNMENYLEDVNINNVSVTGIKEPCIWHDVEGFSVLDNVGVDVMHDLLEGVCKYDLCLMLSAYIFELKLFTIQTLNDRISSFDYGPDRRNQPPCLLADHLLNNTIKMSASEMLCFVRYFGLLLDDLIPENDHLFELYVTLRKIIDIVTSTALHKNSCELLKSLVSEHNTIYLHFSKKNLTPKFHFLLHYHDMLRKFGPLVSIWSMRYEAKHRISKLCANVSSSRRNICKTLAIKHQLLLNYTFLNDDLYKLIETGVKKCICENKRQEIVEKLNIVAQFIHKCNWLIIKGTKYTSNMLLSLDVVNDYIPIFGLIENIYITDKNMVIFEVSSFETLYFDETLYCYVVTDKEEATLFVNYENLYSYIPNTLSISRDCKAKYVTVRSPL